MTVKPAQQKNFNLKSIFHAVFWNLNIVESSKTPERFHSVTDGSRHRAPQSYIRWYLGSTEDEVEEKLRGTRMARDTIRTWPRKSIDWGLVETRGPVGI